MSEEMFGPEPDEDTTEVDGEGIPQTKIDLGDGNHMTLNPSAIRALMSHPATIEALKESAAKVVSTAQSLAQVPGAIYGYELDTSGDRPEIKIMPMNDEAREDTAAHSTLLIASAAAGGTSAEPDEGMEEE